MSFDFFIEDYCELSILKVYRFFFLKICFYTFCDEKNPKMQKIFPALSVGQFNIYFYWRLEQFSFGNRCLIGSSGILISIPNMVSSVLNCFDSFYAKFIKFGSTFHYISFYSVIFRTIFLSILMLDIVKLKTNCIFL